MMALALVSAVFFIAVFLYTNRLEMLVWGIILLLLGSIGGE